MRSLCANVPYDRCPSFPFSARARLCHAFPSACDEQAERHFAAATEIDRLGAPLLLARTRAGWARALIARGRPEDLDRSGLKLEQAEDTAGRLGVQWIAREVTECRAARAGISS